MNIDKSQILDFLRSQGDHGKTDQAEKELPDQVDTDRDGGLLSKFGIDFEDLIAKFGRRRNRQAARLSQMPSR